MVEEVAAEEAVLVQEAGVVAERAAESGRRKIPAEVESAHQAARTANLLSTEVAARASSPCRDEHTGLLMRFPQMASQARQAKA